MEPNKYGNKDSKPMKPMNPKDAQSGSSSKTQKSGGQSFRPNEKQGFGQSQNPSRDKR